MKSSKTIRRKAKDVQETKRKLKATQELENESFRDSYGPRFLSTPKERRQVLGQGNRKAISIRIPENDLAEIQKIATLNGRKYQQLIVQAIEMYIDNYHRLNMDINLY